MIPVNGHSGLARDPRSKAIININSTDIEKARMLKKKRREAAQNDEQLRTKVSTLQNEVSDIKIILNKILEKL